MSKSKQICNCNSCEQQFEKQGDLKEHRTKQHASVGTFSCDECDKLFTEEWKLKAHVKSHNRFSCELCDKKFKFGHRSKYASGATC